MKTIRIFLCFAAAAFGASALCAQAQKPTLAIANVDATPALMQKIKAGGRDNVFERISQSLGDEIGAALQGANRFQIVARGDFSKLLAEQDFAQSGNVDAADKNAAQPGKIKGAQHLLVVTVTDFQDYVEYAKFETLGKESEIRVIRFGAIAKLYDPQTGLMSDSFSYTMNSIDAQEVMTNVYRTGNSNEAMISEITKLAAKRIADGFSERIFPIRVLTIRGNIITLNRGEGSEIKEGDVLDVFALGEKLIDFDTKENLGTEEVFVGSAVVVRIMPKYSQATLNMNNGIEPGCIVRKAKISK